MRDDSPDGSHAFAGRVPRSERLFLTLERVELIDGIGGALEHPLLIMWNALCSKAQFPIRGGQQRLSLAVTTQCGQNLAQLSEGRISSPVIRKIFAASIADRAQKGFGVSPA